MLRHAADSTDAAEQDRVRGVSRRRNVWDGEVLVWQVRRPEHGVNRAMFWKPNSSVVRFEHMVEIKEKAILMGVAARNEVLCIW